jgi:hypothetical protein
MTKTTCTIAEMPILVRAFEITLPNAKPFD